METHTVPQDCATFSRTQKKTNAMGYASGHVKHTSESTYGWLKNVILLFSIVSDFIAILYVINT